MYKVILVALLLTSCTYVQKPLDLKEEEIEYAEDLFKRQNQVTLQAMMLFEDELSIAEEDRLSEAELQMHDQCRWLNDAANHEIAGKKIDIFFQRQVQKSLKPCEMSVQKVESILEQLN